MAKKFLRIDELTTTKGKRGRYPISPATWWRWISTGDAPQGLKLGANTTVWDEDALDKWDAEKVALAGKNSY